jgi:hypothetical protein
MDLWGRGLARGSGALPAEVGVARGGGVAPPAVLGRRGFARGWGSCPRSVESSQNENFRTGFGKNGFAKSRPDAGFCCAESLRNE